LLEGHDRRDRGQETGDWSYVDENNEINAELGSSEADEGLSGEAPETAKIGKRFHTGNMGFPPGVAEVEDQVWLKNGGKNSEHGLISIASAGKGEGAACLLFLGAIPTICQAYITETSFVADSN
jgi:hypothetical protein